MLHLQYAIMMTSLENEELKEAAERGDVELLKNCIASNKPTHYYLSMFQDTEAREGTFLSGNIFHFAALRTQAEFIKEAIESLPLEVLQQLILQRCSQTLYNPLHIAAEVGNVEIVKMFLNIQSTYKELRLTKSKKGHTPCHVALLKGSEDCALEILRMDMDLLCKMEDGDGPSILFQAVYIGFSKFALEILKSPSSFSYKGINGYTPLHYVTNCSEGQEIQRLLLERKPDQVQQISRDGFSILHTWAMAGKVWPFEHLLKSNDIIPNVTRIVYYLMSTTTSDNIVGGNPLHYLAVNTSGEEVAQIAKLLIDTYKQEASTQASSSLSSDHFPWYSKDKKGSTPLDSAIAQKNTSFALYIMSAEDNTLLKTKSNPLLNAVCNGYDELAESILEIVEEKGWDQLLTSQIRLNALHYAPRCKKEFFERLLEKYPSLLEGIDKNGITVLQTWTKVGQKWPFEYVLQSEKLEKKWRSSFIKRISTFDHKFGGNPFHKAANVTNEATTDEIAKLLVEAYKDEYPKWRTFSIAWLPWFTKNKAHDGPLHLAIRNKRENLALYILSLLRDYKSMENLLDFYVPVHKTLFLAIEYNCFQVAKVILTRLNKSTWKKYLINEPDGRSILHFAPSCTDHEFRTSLLETTSEFIVHEDKNSKTPIDEAWEIGADWFIHAVLEKRPSAFNEKPLAWVKACENGHVKAIRAFIEHDPGNFRDLCVKHKTSPLHHIVLRSLTSYEEFLKIPRMKDLINIQDSHGATPLHIAIRKRNIHLTEVLLDTDKIMHDIMDESNITAIDMLEERCKADKQWVQMCNKFGLDPRIIKTSYIQRKTNLLDVRNTLSVVATLLATITFTAGFTLPGGFDQNTGEALLAKKVVFCVFLVSDTLAMCFSMLVLICLIWSTKVYDSNKSLFFIDRSMRLLMLALYLTLLAFMTGVYVVISPKSLWAAIVIICMCSILGISANSTLLYKILDKLIPSTTKEHDQRDPMHMLELGHFIERDGRSGCLKGL